jgi:hypothetical protein
MPAGLSAGDEVTIAINVGNTGGTAPTITAPGTATLVLSTTWGDGSYTVRSSIYRYKYVGSGDPSSFTFTHTSNVSDGRAIAHSGVDGTTPDDATAVATTSSNTGPTGYNLTVTGITTANTNSLVLIWRWSWDGNAITPPGGWTERIDQVITWEGEQLFASAGATGNVTVPSGSSSGVAPAAAIVRALREATGGGGLTGTASLAGTGSISATGVVGKAASATLAGTGSISATGVVGKAASATLAGTGAITATGSVTSGLSGSATFTGTGAITATGVVGKAGTATLAGTGAVTATGVVGKVATATLAGTGAITATGTVGTSGALTGTATLAGTGTITATGVKGLRPTAALAGTGSIEASGVVGGTGTAIDNPLYLSGRAMF